MISVRDYAKAVGFTVVGKLKRMPDKYYGMDNKHHYPWYIDEAGNEYLIDNKSDQHCIITAEGHVI